MKKIQFLRYKIHLVSCHSKPFFFVRNFLQYSLQAGTSSNSLFTVCVRIHPRNVHFYNGVTYSSLKKAVLA